jgi:hypothetical protein
MADEIDLPKLKSIINSMLDFMIEHRRINKLPILRDQDHYWSVAGEVHLPIDPQNLVAPEPTIGSVSEDWEFLLLAIKDDDLATPPMLLHAAPILRYIAHIGLTCSNGSTPTS